MLRNKLRILSIIIAGTLVAGIGNFIVFVYFYKVMCVEYLLEPQRMVHVGMMFDEVLPAYFLAALVFVGILVLATYRFVGSAGREKAPK